MTNKLELYKCKLCGNIVEIVHEGNGDLVCCNKNMELIETNIAVLENRHFAHVEYIDNLTKKITLNHPMDKSHHIEFIEVISNDAKYIKRKYLKVDEPCELTFRCECNMGFYVRVYCNIDGLWETEI